MRRLNLNHKTIIHNPAYFWSFIWSLLMLVFWNSVNTLTFFWWGVKKGQRCSFKGGVNISRFPDSKIEVGNKCSFYSSQTINRVGLYVPCMLSTFSPKAIILIGDNCGFSGTRIWAACKVQIGNNVRCGANTFIADSDAHTDDYRAGNDSPVIIDDNVWLGMDVKILKGVHIGANSLIAAGSIVTKDIPSNVVAGGIPCKIIKHLVQK